MALVSSNVKKMKGPSLRANKLNAALRCACSFYFTHDNMIFGYIYSSDLQYVILLLFRHSDVGRCGFTRHHCLPVRMVLL